jgi:hypothetical protein
MRKNLIITIAFLAFAFSCYSQVPSYVPTTGLVGWWPFSGNANDLSAENNHGTVNGATASSDRFANPNSAYSFNGTSNYIQVADDASLDFTFQYSFSVWVQLADYSLSPGNNAQRTILSKQRSANNVGYSFRALDVTPNPLKYGFVGNNFIQTQTMPSIDTFALATWVHIVYTYDGIVGKMYKNGVLMNSSSFTFIMVPSNKPLFFGKEFDSGNNGAWFKGNLDDIGMWNRPLTLCEITNLYNASLVTANASPATICAGATSVLTGSGAATYTWNPGGLIVSPTVTPATTTIYTVTGTNANGCTGTATVTVTVNPAPIVTAGASPATICAGASTVLTGGGALSYTWNPGALVGNPTVIPAVTTTYTVSGTGANGCVGTATVTVSVNPLPTITASASPQAICSGGSSLLTAGGGASYIWNPGALIGTPTVSPVATTTYTVSGTDVNGCVGTSFTTVTLFPNPVITANASPSSICQGGSTILTGGGAATYLWNPGGLVGSPTVSPPVLTTYTVTGTDLNGCTGTASVTVIVNALPIVTANATPGTICQGASSMLMAGGALSYLWNPGALPGNPTVSPISTTTYTVSGTDVNGCVGTAFATVTVNPAPSVTASASPNSICLGASSILTGSGAATYSWNPGALVGNPTVSPFATTTYTVEGTDQNGCTASAITTVTVIPNPIVSASASPAAICVGDSSILTGSGAATYLWSPGGLLGNPSVNPLVTTSYSVIGTDANGCTGSSVATVTVNLLPNVTAIASPDTICAGATAVLNGGGAATYNWNPGALVGNPTVTPVITTTYTVTGIDINGCSGTAVTTVSVNAAPFITANASPSAICSGASTVLTGSGGNSYSWNPGALVGTPTVTPAISTTYTVTGTDAIGCTATSSITVTVNATPLISNNPVDATVILGNNAQFTTLTSTPGATYQWQSDLGAGFVNINNGGQYSGVTTSTLVVSNVTIANDNQQYRCVISLAPCTSTSSVAILHIQSNVGVNELSEDHLLAIFPNPAINELNIKVHSKLIGYSFDVFDPIGKRILSGVLHSETTSIDLSNLSSGHYMVKVGTIKGHSFKFIKK